jgi:anaerobic selenocysteine-containing dehydrogenase
MAGNPLVDEVSRSNPFTYNIVMNAATAKKKGIKDGDIIVVENPWGDRVTGNVKLTELIHERVLGIVGLGTWNRGRNFEPRGILYNQLLRLGAKYMDPVVGSCQESINVKAYKAEVST